MSLFNLFKPAPHPPQIEDKDVIDREYRYWRIRIFYSMYAGYVFFYFTRKSFTFAMPAMIQELGFSKAELGWLATILYITYGFSKFVNGVLSDRSNPRYFMAIGLILTGIFNFLFGMSSSIFFFALFWGLNGWFQGWGWPPITKQLTYWYAKHERGTWWSICSTSHNIGGALIPLLAGFLAQHYGWRYAMHVPGAICILYGLLLLNRMRDVPQSLGLPPIEVYKGQTKDVSEEKTKEAQDKNLPTPKQILFEHVLNNKFVWMLAVSYFFVYIVRTAVNDWTVVYLMEERQYLNETIAGGNIAMFELGGFFGMLAAGWGTDYFFKGRRVPFMMLCALGLVVSMALFWVSPPGHIYLDYTLMTVIGFLVFGPQMLVGLAAAELVSKKAACTANGFAGCWAYAGAAFTGGPLGKIIDEYSWDGFFTLMLACCVATYLILWPIRKVQGYKRDESVDKPSWDKNLRPAKSS